MKKNKLTRWGGLKLILFVPLIILLLQAFAIPKTLIENFIEVVPDIQQDATPPSFSGNPPQNLINTEGDKWEYTDFEKISNVRTIREKNEYGNYTKTPPVKPENVLLILINRENKILVNGEYLEFKELRR